MKTRKPTRKAKAPSFTGIKVEHNAPIIIQQPSYEELQTKVVQLLQQLEAALKPKEWPKVVAVPRTWWDRFKQEMFPACALRRWPVRHNRWSQASPGALCVLLDDFDSSRKDL